MIKKAFKILLYGLLAIVSITFLLMVYPKGDLSTQLRKKNVPAIGYAIIENGEIIESEVIGELEAGIKAEKDAPWYMEDLTKESEHV